MSLATIVQVPETRSLYKTANNLLHCSYKLLHNKIAITSIYFNDFHFRIRIGKVSSLTWYWPQFLSKKEFKIVTRFQAKLLKAKNSDIPQIMQIWSKLLSMQSKLAPPTDLRLKARFSHPPRSLRSAKKNYHPFFSSGWISSLENIFVGILKYTYKQLLARDNKKNIQNTGRASIALSWFLQLRLQKLL